MKTPNQKEKILMYESFLHKINSFIVSCNNDGIKELVENADSWSYCHRIGNGEISDRVQQQLINNSFWKLLDTPKTYKAVEDMQKKYSEAHKK
jgi:hypothetical protein